jgi:hypothetical protein
MPAEVATWEDENKVRNRFPTSRAWGQAAGKGGEDVMIPYGESFGAATTYQPSSDETEAKQCSDNSPGPVKATCYANADWTK